jgi:hypothetical protein
LSAARLGRGGGWRQEPRRTKVPQTPLGVHPPPLQAFLQRVLDTAAALGPLPSSCVPVTPATEAYHRAHLEGRAHGQLRHVAQQVSIVGNMERRGLLDPSLTYVEFGAGRGMLSLALAAALPATNMVLVDNSAVRWGCRADGTSAPACS